jgi:hypothetical protein
MNLYEFIGQKNHVGYGLEVTLTDSGFKYITRQVYKTDTLGAYWVGVRQGGTIKQGAPALDAVPLWTTETYSVFEDPSVTEITVDFSKIKELSDFSDHSLYTIYAPYQAVSLLGNVVFTDLVNGPDHDEVNSEIVVPDATTVGRSKLPLSNIYSLTKSSKMNPFDFLWHHTQSVPRMISICVPFADSNFSDWSLMFKMPDTGLLKVNGGETQVLPGVGKQQLSSMFPSVKFKTNTATVAADGTVDIDFQLVDASGNAVTTHDADIYLETTAGIVNKQRVTTKNGAGTVTFIASHLKSGDKAKVKCGFKYFTGTSDCLVTVQ